MYGLKHLLRGRILTILQEKLPLIILDFVNTDRCTSMEIRIDNRKTVPVASDFTSSELRVAIFHCFFLAVSCSSQQSLYLPFKVLPIAPLCVSSSLSLFVTSTFLRNICPELIPSNKWCFQLIFFFYKGKERPLKNTGTWSQKTK